MVTGCRGTGIEPEKNEWLEATRELVGEMCELARNEEAAEWLTNDWVISNTGALDCIREMGEGTYDRPRKGWVAEVPKDITMGGLTLSEKKATEEKWRSRGVPEALCNRGIPSSMVAAFRGGAGEGYDEVRACSILTRSKTYI